MAYPFFIIKNRKEEKVINNNDNIFESALALATSLPLVHINREEFLSRELKRFCPTYQVNIAIEHSPAYANISVDIIDKIANECINYETNKVSSISFLTGLPGGIAMFGTIPADITQYLGHILRILQKLAYLYGWDEFIKPNEKLDDNTANILTLFIGVMFGVNGAASTISKLSASAAQNASKKLASQALTKGTIYPIVKKIAQTLGVKMTKEIFAKGVSKIIPVVGGVISGGLTYANFKPCANRLKKYLASLIYS